MAVQLSFGDPYGWISREERLPGPEDGDAQGCVLAWHLFNGTMVAGTAHIYGYCETPGWQRVRECEFFTHWQKTPGAPMGTRNTAQAAQAAPATDRGGIAWRPGQ